MNRIVWTPKTPETSRMWQFMRFAEQAYQKRFETYQDLHAWSVREPAHFWQCLCDYFHLRFDTRATEIIKRGDALWDTRWFVGAKWNVAEKLLSRNDDHTAIVSIDERGARLTLSYKELQSEVSRCAAGLKSAGVITGDRVAAVMPNVAATVIAMLATASLGAVWSSCSPDFGKDAILDRLSQIEPKVLFACDGHIYHGKTHDALTKIADLAAEMPSLTHIVICPVLGEAVNLSSVPKATLWDDFLKPSQGLTFMSLPFDHPLYILFSSGTTGKPKCIVHGAGGTLLQHMKELGLHTDMCADDRLFFYTTCGWMMWNWMVSVLALGATLVLYEGSPTTPTPDRLFKLIDEEQISVFGTSAKFLSEVEKLGISPCQTHTFQHLRRILGTGSPLLPKHFDFVNQHIKEDLPLHSISGGTDIVSCFALGNPIMPVYKGELQCLGLGMDVDVFDDQGHSVQGAQGELVCKSPFPSMPIGFWQDPDKIRYKAAYFERYPGVWAHGDFAELTPHGGLIIYGRSDAVLNPGGVRIGTAEIYRQVEKFPEVLNSVVIGQKVQDDVRVVLFVKLREGLSLTEALETKIRQSLRNNASPRHVPAKILQVKDIPLTLSGKVVEIAVRQIVHGQPIENLSSIANPEALAYFKDREELKEAH